MTSDQFYVKTLKHSYCGQCHSRIVFWKKSKSRNFCFDCFQNLKVTKPEMLQAILNLEEKDPDIVWFFPKKVLVRIDN